MRKILTGALFILPVVFFGVCYFLMTVWGEDIIHGAGTTPDVWNDIKGAFMHNSRLSDMYAWTVINFFDFQYSFGVDTIFRLIDVVMAAGIFYLMTSMMLGRRPKWKLEDALLFGLSFLTVMLTPHGYTMYRGFSVIHNYLIIGLSTIGFGLPFVRSYTGEEVPKLYQKWWFALVIGLVFGMSSNITPVAFLIWFVLMKVWQGWREKAWKKVWRLPAWQVWMLAGMVITVAIAYVFGAGVSTYANNPVYTETYDYVAVNEIFTSFGSSLVRIAKHIAVNFGYCFGMVGAMAVILGGLAIVVAKITKKELKIWPKETASRRVIGANLGFAAVYLLCGSQITLPVRLALPAYLALVVALGVLVKGWWIESGVLDEKVLEPMLSVLAVGLMVLIVVFKAEFAIEYRGPMRQAFETIRESTDETVCLSPEIAKPKKLPFVNLGQDETFGEWALPHMTVYRKKVEYCSQY